MICLTGDLHHMGLRTGNQLHCDITELQTAQRFLRILEERRIKVTFFVSGRCFTDEWRDLEPIVSHPLVELGGHNFSCLTPEILHRASKKILGSYNGPAWLQRLDVEATKAVAKRRTGRTIRLWRNHMYMHGPHTERVLRDAGMLACSDGVQKASNGPVLHADTGLLNWPINVIPDHEHLYHAERTVDWVRRWQRRYQWSDDFGPDSYYIERWTELVLDGLRENEERGVISNMIIHPITMYLCDRFAAFERIADFLAERTTVHMGEACERALASGSPRRHA